MNIPKEFWRAKLEDITHPDTHRVIERYMDLFEDRLKSCHGLRLYGTAGVGKTAIAAMLAKEARSRKHTVFFMMIWELRECVRSREPFDGPTSVLDRCREVDVLVLDGLVEDEAYEKLVNVRMLEQLITWRGQRGKLTIVTTRIDKQDFKKKGLASFDAGTKQYLFPYPVKGESKRDSLVKDMRSEILGEGD